jgi:aldehyde dehydrogenase (NAD+)
MSETSKAVIEAKLAKLRESFRSNTTKPLSWREDQLLKLRKLVDENQELLFAALHRDLGRSRFEAIGATSA